MNIRDQYGRESQKIVRDFESLIKIMVGCVAQLAERRSLAGELTLGLQLTGDHYMSKPSATGQPTRPT